MAMDGMGDQLLSMAKPTAETSIVAVWKPMKS